MAKGNFETNSLELTDPFMIKQLPYSMEAEQAVLGALILDSERLTSVVGILSADDFYVDKHIAIFASMQELSLQNKHIDAVTLVNSLVNKGVYKEEGAAAYFKQLAEAVPSVTNCADYARIVHDKALLRRLITISEEISRSAFEGSEPVQHILDAAESKVFALAQGFITHDFIHIHDIILEFYKEQLPLLQHNKDEARGIPTYFSDLDRFIVGMTAGNLVLLGARPGIGKTSMATNIATAVAKNKKQAVAIFSLEMSRIEMVTRILSSEARVDSHKLRSGDLQDDDFARLAEAATALSHVDIYVDDTSNITVSEMRAKLRRLKNLGFVVIDYLQLMSSDRRIDNRAQEVGEITRNLKILAKELQVPIMLLSQLVRDTEKKGRKPMLSDLRESGSIEQDADMVFFLYKDESGGTGENDNIIECIIAKNRHGSTGSVKLGWEGRFTRFGNLDTYHEEP